MAKAETNRDIIEACARTIYPINDDTRFVTTHCNAMDFAVPFGGVVAEEFTEEQVELNTHVLPNGAFYRIGYSDRLNVLVIWGAV